MLYNHRISIPIDKEKPMSNNRIALPNTKCPPRKDIVRQPHIRRPKRNSARTKETENE